MNADTPCHKGPMNGIHQAARLGPSGAWRGAAGEGEVGRVGWLGVGWWGLGCQGEAGAGLGVGGGFDEEAEVWVRREGHFGDR